MHGSYKRALALTIGAACGSAPGGAQHAPVEPVVRPHEPVAVPAIDAAVADPAPARRLVCDAGTTPVPAPALAPTWYCARPDGTRHGPFLTLFPDDSIEIEGAYRDGLLDGPWTRRRPDGTVAEEGAYQAGLKHGRWRQLGPDGSVLGEYTLTGGTGVERVWYDSGALYRERALRAGVPHGEDVTFAPDGAVTSSAVYRDGKLDGPHAFGTRATMRFEETFADGVRHGDRTIWLLGKLLAEERFDHRGQPDGPFTHWRRPRVMRVKGAYDHAARTGLWTWWDRGNRKEREGRYVAGKRDGVWTEWAGGKLAFTGRYTAGRPDGELVYYDRRGRELGRFTIRNGTGTMFAYHPNGRPSLRQRFVRGRAEGLYEELTPSGRVIVEGRYLDDEKHGLWTYRATDGVIVREETWDRGQLHGAVKKYAGGALVSEASYRAGKAHGAYAEYRDGRPALTGEHVDDRKHGTWTTYAVDGTVILTATYERGVLHGPWRQRESDGSVLEGQMLDGRRTGTWTRTDPSGRVSQLTYGPP